jgi:subtilisin-like proprotein convertase family protein
LNAVGRSRYRLFLGGNAFDSHVIFIQIVSEVALKFARHFLPLATLLALILAVASLSAGSPSRPNPFEGKNPSFAKQELEELQSYELRMQQGQALNENEKFRFDELSERYADQLPHGRDAVDNVGGPDGFGYTYVDNQGGDSATFEWIELGDDPLATWLTWTGSHDDNQQALNFEMTFPFYGGNYTTCNVSTNGTIQFATALTTYSNVCLPTTSFNGPVIFPYWDDLHLDYGGQGTSGSNVIAWRNFGDFVVIEYDSIGHCCSAGTSLKFETIMFADGRLKLQYQNMVFGTNANTQTIGIQAGSTGPALQYVCSATGIQPVNNLAIWFSLGESGSISGTVQDNNGQPIFQARVANLGVQGASTFTDNQGHYSFPTVPTGTYTLVATKRGYGDDSVSVTVTANQNATGNLTLQDLGLQVFQATDVPVAIPATGTITATMTIAESFNIADLDVVLDIAHTFDGDLSISLTSPEGTVVPLITRRGGSGDNFTNTALDDEAVTPIATGTAPFTGDFIPESPLSTFDTQTTIGTWTLTVNDGTAGDSGSVLGWGLYVTPGATDGGAIEGTVRNQVTQNPIPNARVEVAGTGLVRFTNTEGFYRFGFVGVGTYTVDYSAVFYEPETRPNITVTNGGTVTLNVAMSSNVIPYAYGGEPVAIADNDTAFAIIHVPDDFAPEYVIVELTSITHTFDGDLQIWLRDPAGTTVLLSDRNGGGGDNYIQTVLADSAPTPIASGTAPFTGMFSPEEPLSVFIGGAAVGDWTLVVYDAAAGDQGTIDSWQIIFGGSNGPRGDLEGVVVSTLPQQPLAGATVTIVELAQSTTTNQSGEYSFHGVTTGTYVVRFQHAGFCDFVANNVEIQDGQTTTLNAAMQHPNAVFSVTSINQGVIIGRTSTTTFTISNTGNCPLTWSLTDTSAWLTESPAQGTVPASQMTEITLTFDATDLAIGEYQSRITITHSAANSPYQIPVSLAVASSAGESVDLPTEFALLANYPNPFNSSTELRFDVPQTAAVSLVLYNLLGQEVATLINSTMQAGHHTVNWNGRDRHGVDVGTGIYIVQLRSEGHVFTSKLMMLR